MKALPPKNDSLFGNHINVINNQSDRIKADYAAANTTLVPLNRPQTVALNAQRGQGRGVNDFFLSLDDGSSLFRFKDVTYLEKDGVISKVEGYSIPVQPMATPRFF